MKELLEQYRASKIKEHFPQMSVSEHSKMEHGFLFLKVDGREFSIFHQDKGLEEFFTLWEPATNWETTIPLGLYTFYYEIWACEQMAQRMSEIREEPR
jgi:hypothetical protein